MCQWASLHSRLLYFTSQLTAPNPLPTLQFARLHDDMQKESCHDRAALQQLADSLAAPDTIPLLK
jgi:hypothetical protein